MSSITAIIHVAQPRTTESPRGWIDRPKAGATVYAETLELEGWVLDWHPTGPLGEPSKAIVRRVSKRRPVH